MSIEKTFELINDGLQNLRKLFDNEVGSLRLEFDRENEAMQQMFERENEVLGQRIEFYRTEVEEQYLRHRAECERLKNETLAMEARFVRLADTRPIEKEFLECLPGMAFIADADGTIVDSNEAYAVLFGGQKSFPLEMEAFARASETGSWSGELKFVNPLGSEMVLDARLFVWNKNSGEIGGFVCVAMDKTRLLTLGQEIQTMKNEIESLNQLLSGCHNEQKKELRCVVLGSQGSGKTSLLNKLIGERIFGSKMRIRCGHGAKRALVAHFWNGGRELCLDAPLQKTDEFIAQDEAVWLEWRLPEAKSAIMFEELHALPKFSDVFIVILELRDRFSRQWLMELERSLKDGAYGIFVISKIDLETDDGEGTQIALSASEKIETERELLRRDLAAFEKLRDCPIIPISTKDELNLDVLRWYINDAASSVSPGAAGGLLPETRYPQRGKDVRVGEPNALLPMVEIFRDQEFQTKFAQFLPTDKRKFVLLGHRGNDAHKLISRLAHDISFERKLRGTENKWVMFSPPEIDLPWTADSVHIEPPESLLKKLTFVLAPQDENLDLHDWDALFADYTPIVTLSPELENASYKNALKRHGFHAVCGDGLMFSDEKIEEAKLKLQNFAGREVPLFVYENYDVLEGRVIE